MRGGGGGRLFEGGNYLKYFHQRGAIVRGIAGMRGNMVSFYVFVFVFP